MKILLLILVAVIIFLAREITILESYLSNVSGQNTQTTNTGLWFESSEVSPNGRYKATSYTGDYADRNYYYQLFITDLTNDRMHRIYAGDYRTLDWQWTADDQIKISHDCGTGCKTTRIIGINDYVSFESDKGSNWKLE